MRTLSLCKVEQEMLADIVVKYQASNATFFFFTLFCKPTIDKQCK